MLRNLFLFIVVTLVSISIFAQEKIETKKDGNLSLTISPVHLALPVFEFTGEFKLNESTSFALIGGAGNAKYKNNIFKTFEVGAQFNYYLLGDFYHGMQLGLEALYIYVSANNYNRARTASGMAMGPYAGYKYISESGFTFNTQLGVEYAVINANGESRTDGDSAVFVLLNINIGWTF